LSILSRLYGGYVITRKGQKLNIADIALDNPINTPMLEEDFRIQLEGNDWWGGIQAGITLPLLVAPIAYTKKIKNVYIAGGLPKSFPHPWSDRAEIYNSLYFADVRIICDDYNMTRLDKLREIKKRAFFKLKLRVCLEDVPNKFNCGYCEKCARTIAELSVLDLDPRDFGFEIDLSQYPRHILKLARKVYSNPIEKYIWSEIVEEAKKNKSYVANDKRALVEALASIVPRNDHKHETLYLNSLPSVSKRLLNTYYKLPLRFREFIEYIEEITIHGRLRRIIGNLKNKSIAKR